MYKRAETYSETKKLIRPNPAQRVESYELIGSDKETRRLEKSLRATEQEEPGTL